MANTIAPSGFRAVQDRTGGAFTGKTRGVIILGTDANVIGIGDFVKFTGTSAEGRDGTQYSVITKAVAADTRLAGGIVSLDYDPTGYKIHNPATSGVDRIAYIPQDPNTLYVAQEDGNMGVVATESNVDFLVGAVDVFTGSSTSSIDSSTSNTTSTLPLRVVGMEKSIGNEVGANATWYVTINQDAYTDKAGL
jgi:hypothetical protein